MRTKNPVLKQQITSFVNDFYRSERRSPSFQEIGDYCGTSKVQIYRYVLEMRDEGLIEYDGKSITTSVSSKCNSPAKVSAPIVGVIGCGDPTSEEENIEEYVNLPEAIFGKGDFYILRARGDSMVDAGIEPGDLVVIDKDAQPINGSVVVALNDESENTLKRFDGFEGEKAVLSYMNEATYPGKRILVDYFTCQGVAKHIIKSLCI